MSLCFKCFFLEFHNVLKTYCKLFLTQNTIFHLKIYWAFWGAGRGFKFWGGFLLFCFFVNFVKKLCKISLSIVAKVTFSSYYILWLIQQSGGHFFASHIFTDYAWAVFVIFLPWYQSSQHHFKVKYWFIWNSVSCHIKTENHSSLFTCHHNYILVGWVTHHSVYANMMVLCICVYTCVWGVA